MNARFLLALVAVVVDASAGPSPWTSWTCPGCTAEQKLKQFPAAGQFPPGLSRVNASVFHNTSALSIGQAYTTGSISITSLNNILCLIPPQDMKPDDVAMADGQRAAVLLFAGGGFAGALPQSRSICQYHHVNLVTGVHTAIPCPSNVTNGQPSKFIVSWKTTHVYFLQDVSLMSLNWQTLEVRMLVADGFQVPGAYYVRSSSQWMSADRSQHYVLFGSGGGSASAFRYDTINDVVVRTGALSDNTEAPLQGTEYTQQIWAVDSRYVYAILGQSNYYLVAFDCTSNTRTVILGSQTKTLPVGHATPTMFGPPDGAFQALGVGGDIRAQPVGQESFRIYYGDYRLLATNPNRTTTWSISGTVASLVCTLCISPAVNPSAPPRLDPPFMNVLGYQVQVSYDVDAEILSWRFGVAGAPLVFMNGSFFPNAYQPWHTLSITSARLQWKLNRFLAHIDRVLYGYHSNYGYVMAIDMDSWRSKVACNPMMNEHSAMADGKYLYIGAYPFSALIRFDTWLPTTNNGTPTAYALEHVASNPRNLGTSPPEAHIHEPPGMIRFGPYIFLAGRRMRQEFGGGIVRYNVNTQERVGLGRGVFDSYSYGAFFLFEGMLYYFTIPIDNAPLGLTAPADPKVFVVDPNNMTVVDSFVFNIPKVLHQERRAGDPRDGYIDFLARVEFSEIIQHDSVLVGLDRSTGDLDTNTRSGTGLIWAFDLKTRTHLYQVRPFQHDMFSFFQSAFEPLGNGSAYSIWNNRVGMVDLNTGNATWIKNNDSSYVTVPPPETEAYTTFAISRGGAHLFLVSESFPDILIIPRMFDEPDRVPVEDAVSGSSSRFALVALLSPVIASALSIFCLQ